MQEEVALSEGIRPMNATFGEVFDDFYNPFEDTELRLAPSATPTGKNITISEAELYAKCPQLVQPTPPPAPPHGGNYTVCTSYSKSSGDGYSQQFGANHNQGGFSPLVATNRLEPMYFGVAPNNASLATSKHEDVSIGAGDVKAFMPGTAARSISSLKYKNREFLRTGSHMFSTAAFDVPVNANETLTRSEEAALNKALRTTSKVLAAYTSGSSAFTGTQTAYTLVPGTVVNGVVVKHKSTLSDVVISKRVTVSPGNVMRYNVSFDVNKPFTSVHFEAPRMVVSPNFTQAIAYDKRSKKWVHIPAKTTLLASTYLAAILYTSNANNALGIRIVDAPHPKSFGSSFATSLRYAFVNGSVSVSQTIGSQAGNENKTLAPSGRYSLTTDFVLGTLARVQTILTKVIGGGGGGGHHDKCTCPKCTTTPGKKLPPVTPKKDVVVLAKVTYAHGSVYKLTYAFGGKTKTSQLATHAEISFAQTHHLKVGSKVYLTLTSDGKIKKMSMSPEKKTPSATPKKDVVVLAKVTYAHGSVYRLTYAFGGKTKTSQLATHAEISFAQTHHLKVGSKVYLTLTSDGKIKKMSTSPEKKTPSAKDDGDDDDKHSRGHVTKVPGKHTFHVTYVHHGHKRTFAVTHHNHGRKPGDTVTVSKDPGGKMTSWTAGGGSSLSAAECKKKGGTLGAGGSPCYTWGYCHALKKEPLYDSNNLVAGCKSTGSSGSSGSSTGKFQLIKPTCDKWSPVCGTGGDCSRAGKGYTCQNGCCKCSDPNMWNGRNCSGKGKTISYDTWNSTHGEPSGGCPNGMKWNSDKQMCQFPLIKACPYSFQTRNSAGQCVGCPSGTTWNNTTKKCV